MDHNTLLNTIQLEQQNFVAKWLAQTFKLSQQQSQQNNTQANNSSNFGSNNTNFGGGGGGGGGSGGGGGGGGGGVGVGGVAGVGGAISGSLNSGTTPPISPYTPNNQGGLLTNNNNNNNNNNHQTANNNNPISNNNNNSNSNNNNNNNNNGVSSNGTNNTSNSNGTNQNATPGITDQQNNTALDLRATNFNANPNQQANIVSSPTTTNSLNYQTNEQNSNNNNTRTNLISGGAEQNNQIINFKQEPPTSTTNIGGGGGGAGAITGATNTQNLGGLTNNNYKTNDQNATNAGFHLKTEPNVNCGDTTAQVSGANTQQQQVQSATNIQDIPMSIAESLRTVAAANNSNMFKMETDFWTQGRGPPQNMAQNLSQSSSGTNNGAQQNGAQNGSNNLNHHASGGALGAAAQNTAATNPNSAGLMGAPHSPATGSIHSPGNHSQASSQGGHPTHQILTSGTLALAASMQQNHNCDSVAANALAHHLHQQQQQIQGNQNSPDSKMMTEKLVSELQLAQQAAVLSAAITQQQNQLNSQHQNMNQQQNSGNAMPQTGNVGQLQANAGLTNSRCNSTNSAHNMNLLGSPAGVGSPNTAASNTAAALQAAISGLSGINAAGLTGINAAAALSAALQQQQQLQQFAGFGANGGFGLSPTGQGLNPSGNTGVVGQGNQNPLAAGGNSNSNQGSQSSQGGFSAMSAAINERTLEECWSTLQRILMHKNAMQMHARELGVNSLAGNLASLAGRGPGSLGSDVKPHQCQQCLKSFSSNHQLVQHIRVHTGEKPYKCSYCDRRFKQLSHVQQHTRLHTGERPYKCHLPDCGRAFIQLSNLQQHLRNHDAQVERAKNRPFHCNICGKGFATESSLRTHTSKCVGRLQQHAALLGGPHAATCPLCHRLFLGGGEELMEHMKHTHKDPNASGVASFLNIPNAFGTTNHLSAVTPMDTSNPSDAPLNMSSNASNNANATNNTNGASTANPTGNINNLTGNGGVGTVGTGTSTDSTINTPTNFGAATTPGAGNNNGAGMSGNTAASTVGTGGNGGIATTPTNTGGGVTNNHLQLATPNSAGSNPVNSDYITYNHLAKRRTANHPCPICGKHYVNEGSLRKHLACHPETSQLANTGLRMYPCSACQAVFTHESGLLTHMEHMRMEQKHQFAAQIVLSRAAAERRERELFASQAAMLGLPPSASLVANAASLAAAANQQQSGQLTAGGNPPMSPSAHSDSSSGNGRLSSAGSENGASQQGNATGLLNNNNNNNCTPKLGDILRNNNGLHGSQYNMDTDQLHVNRMAMMAAMTGAAHQTAAGMSPTDVANLAAAMRMGAVSQEFGNNILRFQANNANSGSPNTPPLNTDTLTQQALMMRASMDSMRNLSDMRMDLNTHSQPDALRIHQTEALLRTQAEAALRLAVSQAAVAAATQQQQAANAANQQSGQTGNNSQQNESQNSPLGRHNGGSNVGPFSISQGNQQLSPDLSDALKLQEALQQARLHHQQP